MLRGKPKAQKEKSLPHLNRFLAEKVEKSVVRPSFLVYHFVRCADKAARSALPPHHLPQTPALPLSEMLSLRMQTR